MYGKWYSPLSRHDRYDAPWYATFLTANSEQECRDAVMDDLTPQLTMKIATFSFGELETSFVSGKITVIDLCDISGAGALPCSSSL